MNRLELVLGTKSRSGQQWDIWEAVYSPVGADGYPQRIWDKRTGVIDPKVAAHWRENYDLRHILGATGRRGSGKKLEGKIHIYVGDMDNYYLNNAVYLVEDFLEDDQRSALRRRGGLRRPRRALLERRPRRGRTRSRGCATTRCSRPRSWSASRRRAPAGADLTSWKVLRSSPDRGE